MSIDPRIVCNCLLDEAARSGRDISNLALQKLLYFAHCIFLIENKRPLVSGYFEAWEHGPVHPAAYRAFKAAGARPINFRAEKIDALTGDRSALPTTVPADVARTVALIVAHYGGLTAGRLVEISHAKGAPWHYTVDKGRHAMAFGLRIGDDLIQQRFRFHKVSVGALPRRGEPDEDTPFTGN